MIGFVQSIITIVLFIVILGVLVVIHELGHFVTARLANVRVLEFGVGFPPRAKVLRSKGETLYTLNWLPIGGFVKLEGEDGDEADDPRSFSSQGLLDQALDPRRGRAHEHAARVRRSSPGSRSATPTLGVTVAGVQPDSPAQAAGLQPGDVDHRASTARYVRGLRRAFVARRPSSERAARPSTFGIERADGATTDRLGHAPVAGGRSTTSTGALGVSDVTVATTTA